MITAKEKPLNIVSVIMRSHIIHAYLTIASNTTTLLITFIIT